MSQCCSTQPRDQTHLRRTIVSSSSAPSNPLFSPLPLPNSVPMRQQPSLPWGTYGKNQTALMDLWPASPGLGQTPYMHPHFSSVLTHNKNTTTVTSDYTQLAPGALSAMTSPPIIPSATAPLPMTTPHAPVAPPTPVNMSSHNAPSTLPHTAIASATTPP